MPRSDLSSELVHWIKAPTLEEAFGTLRTIIDERCIRGGNGNIEGEYNCVCFTEAPQLSFHEVRGRYRPFGIQLSKTWVFDRGGRPVIYQTDAEFVVLPPELRWRHVRYEPNRTPPVDFTWEREWRVLADELPLPPGEAIILVPGESWGGLRCSRNTMQTKNVAAHGLQ